MKFNWGIFAFTLFGSFAFFMIGLVIYASMQNQDLVTDKYYEKELEFKEILKKEEKTAQLTEQLKWKIAKEKLIINFPKEAGRKVSGNITFYKPSSAKDDKTIPITSNTLNININDFASGMYIMKIDWQANHINYYNQKQIIIP